MAQPRKLMADEDHLMGMVMALFVMVSMVMVVNTMLPVSVLVTL